MQDGRRWRSTSMYGSLMLVAYQYRCAEADVLSRTLCVNTFDRAASEVTNSVNRIIDLEARERQSQSLMLLRHKLLPYLQLVICGETQPRVTPELFTTTLQPTSIKTLIAFLLEFSL
jgi:hypothetical protein